MSTENQIEMMIPNNSQPISLSYFDYNKPGCCSKCLTILCPCDFFSTTFIILINTILIYFITVLISVNYDIPLPCVLYWAGAGYGYDIKYYFNLHRLIMPTFLHLNIAHLFSNMLALVIFGFDCEAILGRNKYLFLYFGTGITGAFLQSALDNEMGVGASSSLMGIVGFFVIYTISQMHTFQPRYHIYIRIFFLTILSLFAPEPGVGYYAHLGGFLGGILLTFEFIEFDKESYLNIKHKEWSRIIIGVYFTSVFFYFLQKKIPNNNNYCDLSDNNN